MCWWCSSYSNRVKVTPQTQFDIYLLLKDWPLDTSLERCLFVCVFVFTSLHLTLYRLDKLSRALDKKNIFE